MSLAPLKREDGERLAVVETKVDVIDEKVDRIEQQQALFGNDITTIKVTLAEINAKMNERGTRNWSKLFNKGTAKWVTAIVLVLCMSLLIAFNKGDDVANVSRSITPAVIQRPAEGHE
jgi:hypothetical protein